jgi:hypothetical protein
MTHQQGCAAAPSHFVTVPGIFAGRPLVYPADASGRILRGPFRCTCRRRDRDQIGTAAMSRREQVSSRLTETEKTICRNMNVSEDRYLAQKKRNAGRDRESLAAAYLSKGERAVLSQMTTPAGEYLGEKFRRAVCAAARGAGARHAIDSAMGTPEALALADHPPDELLDEARAILGEVEGQAAAPESFKKICLAGALIHFALNQITPAWAALHPEESGSAPDANYAMPAATLAASAKSVVAVCCANPHGIETPRKLATAYGFICSAIRNRDMAAGLR